MLDDSADRLAAQSRPPWALIHSTCSAARNTVASDGVLAVWSRRLCSTAVASDENGAIHRPDAAISSMRASAAGEHAASQVPPSEASAFCGAK